MKILAKTLLTTSATVVLLGGGIASSLVLSSCNNNILLEEFTLNGRDEILQYIKDHSIHVDFSGYENEGTFIPTRVSSKNIATFGANSKIQSIDKLKQSTSTTVGTLKVGTVDDYLELKCDISDGIYTINLSHNTDLLLHIYDGYNWAPYSYDDKYSWSTYGDDNLWLLNFNINYTNVISNTFNNNSQFNAEYMSAYYALEVPYYDEGSFEYLSENIDDESVINNIVLLIFDNAKDINKINFLKYKSKNGFWGIFTCDDVYFCTIEKNNNIFKSYMFNEFFHQFFQYNTFNKFSYPHDKTILEENSFSFKTPTHILVKNDNFIKKIIQNNINGVTFYTIAYLIDGVENMILIS